MIILDTVYQSIKQHINVINATSNNWLLSNGFYQLMFHEEKILILILWLVCKLHYSVENCLLIIQCESSQFKFTKSANEAKEIPRNVNRTVADG